MHYAEELLLAGNMAVAVSGKRGWCCGPLPREAGALLISVASRVSPGAADLLFNQLKAARSVCHTSAASTHDGSDEKVPHPSGLHNVFRDPCRVPSPHRGCASSVLCDVVEDGLQAEAAEHEAFWTQISCRTLHATVAQIEVWPAGAPSSHQASAGQPAAQWGPPQPRGASWDQASAVFPGVLGA